MKMYDTFIPNILEMQGKIERNSFKFNADNLKIWHKGNCISDRNLALIIDASIDPNSGKIQVKLESKELIEIINDFFTFTELSLFKDRIFWSNNLEGGFSGMQDNQPGNMSLFLYNGEVSKVYLNVFNPSEIMLEFNSIKDGEISEAENPWLKAARDLGFS